MTDPAADLSDCLRFLMRQVELSSFKALSLAAGVSEQQVRHLRRGRISQMRLDTLIKLGQALQLPLTDLLQQFGDSTIQNPKSKIVRLSAHAEVQNPHSNQELTGPDLANLKLANLQQEYDRLQTQLAQQQQNLHQEFQQTSLQILESLLLQLPTAAYAAQQNPQAPAIKLLPLLRPIDQLLQHWGISTIAPVGSEVPYDPQCHQLMSGVANPGDWVRVRYTGYQQGDKLLYRAKVSPIEP
jgi:molecular chaperone GrpE (heat shock protein)